jgi:predicted P-loop ATPase
MIIAGARCPRHLGCKLDTAPILEGLEGGKKSTALKILAGGDDFFSDQIILDLNSREQKKSVCAGVGYMS